MMGRQPKVQKRLFYTKFNLDRRIRKDHILRKIDKHINFEFIYEQVKDTYGSKGNVSVPPPVILKMLLLLILYNVRSERELMGTIPERLDWLWFLGYDLDDQIPDHSVLSKARARWGVAAFKAFFEHIVWQCVDAGFASGDATDNERTLAFIAAERWYKEHPEDTRLGAALLWIRKASEIDYDSIALAEIE
jgi:transposase